MKVKILLIIFWIPAFAEMTVTPDLIGGTNLFAQTTDESIFDEGAEVTIDPNDIGEDVRLWAQNTAIKLKELLVKIKTLSIQEKRELLTQKIKECVLEAQNTRELLLMRFALNRALKLSSTFSDSDDELIVHYILLPIIKEAIHIYERADLPYLTANQNKSAEEIESPSYTAFSKAQIGYLLTVSNMNKSPEGQFEILKLALVWVTNDLLRSAETKRNPVNANLILNLKEIYFKYKNLPAEEITYTVLNRIRTMLLKTYQEMVPEKGKVLLPFMIYTPSQPDLVFKPQTKEEIPVKPKEEPKPKKVISNDYDSAVFHWIRMGVGAGIKNNEPILNMSAQVLNGERGDTGVEFYVLKGNFDISNNKEFDSQTMQAGGLRVPFIPILTPHVQLGPYLNIYDYASDEAKKEQYESWFDTGLTCNIQPFPTKNLNININAYWDLGSSQNNVEKTVKVNDLNLSDASQEWQDQYKKMDAEHYQ
ncbi:MAG: hypothetical protein HYY62_08125, partial [Deltaproteobacteria bacterium]|nr:hypothetical protein [Deltaproteobacteria bacterium]